MRTQKNVKVLEFDKILLLLQELALSEGAKDLLKNLAPSPDYQTVLHRQERTAAERALVDRKGYPAFGNVKDVCESVSRAERGTVLSPKELLWVLDLWQTARRLKDYLFGNRVITTVLDDVFAQLMINRSLEERIRHAILSEDSIADEASPELSEIRRKMRHANNRIKEILQQFTTGARSKYLQENIVTVRDGRYVVPVKAEYRNEIKGLLHDTSSSGATVFIEPMAVVEMNNELRDLEHKEKKEIERILEELSLLCGAEYSAVAQNYHFITELAMVFTCAVLAEKMRAVRVGISEKPMLDLKRARHPLLHTSKVVPIDVRLGTDFDTLVITGPNTGGKTVTLKTIGLFAMMTQAGLQIPADETSTVGIFSQILPDIGDEQSIEQSLSTFSSHMVNIIDIIEKVDGKSLVLFDELGAGTDPVEGAALAISILEAIRLKGGIIASTTHYAELKAYALETDGICNGGCEFDIDTLRPTYRLILGTPGKSNAFAISEKLGLPSEIVQRAKVLISEENREFEQVIERLENDRRIMENVRAKTEQEHANYEKSKKEAEQKLQEKSRLAEKEIKEATEKARQILESAKAGSDYIFRQLDEVRKTQEQKDFAQRLMQARGEIRTRIKEEDELQGAFAYEEVNLDEPYVLPRPLKVGDRVYLVSFGQEGDVQSLPDAKGNLMVTAGILKAKVPLTSVRLLENTTKKKREVAKTKKMRNLATVKTDLRVSFRPELDIRGMMCQEGWDRTDKYLDDAMLAGLSTVNIIHGKGTGALRKGLWENFRHDPRIKSYRLGKFGEGDSGVTVIEMK